MGLVLAPILDGKKEVWENWLNELKSGDGKAAFDDFNQRYGLDRHDVWKVETPNGTMSAVLHEGPGGDEFMPKLAQSDNPYDVNFRNKISEVHGLDLSQPPPGPMPEKMT